MKLRPLLYGIATFVPGVNQLRAKGTGGTDSARYCYSVWLRHLVTAKKNGFNPHPEVVAELGPGDSLGIGLAALLSGSDRYFAFDVVEHANIERNLSVLDELVTLFRDKAPIPGNDEWPNVKPRLDDYRFPSDVLDESRLRHALEESRVERIRNSVRNVRQEGSIIEYKVPWYKADVLEADAVDMIYSQAVLEHVDDLESTYKAMYSWLKPAGYMSHAIDFKCHGTADEWNGHWAYSDPVWKLIRGKRPYLLNREPHSTHVALIEKEGFRIVCDKKTTSESKYTAQQLAGRYRSLSREDLVTSGTFIQAIKAQPGGVATPR